MSVLDTLDDDVFNVISNYKFDNMEDYLSCGRIIGLGAMILNGYSYENLLGNITYLCCSSELDGVSDGVSSMVYIPNYKEVDTGVSCNNFTNPERTICDFLMYPKELDADLWIYEALEGYIEDDETPDDFHLVYEMMGHFGIDKSLLDERLADLEDMGSE